MINTQTQIDSLIDLAVLQRTELKQLVDSLPQLRDHLSSEIERNLEEIEPAIRAELEQFVAARALDTQAKTSAELSAKLDAMARNLESTTAAKYSVLMAERAQNATLLAQAEARIAEAASALPSAVKGIVTDELARFPRAGEIDQLRKEFAEPRGLNPRGRWQASETYNKLDLVSYNGDSYVSNTNGNREKPSRSSEAWTLSAARGNGGAGGGVTSLTDLVAVPANGELLIGNGSAFVNNTLTAGTGVTITNGPGTITIDASGAQEVLTATVTNAESFAITRGQVVYLFGATGNRASVKLANNATDAESSKTFGVVSEASIAAGANGLVTCVGTVDKLTLGSYTEGDVLYLGATPGSVTATKPYAPNHLVYVGIVERANNGNGELYVKIQNGYELDEIHDVQITTPPLAGSLLMRDATNSLWKANRLTGTANQVTVTNADTSVTLSLPTAIANVNSVTAATTQNLTLAGGSTGATVVIGQGTTAASATITPTGTGNLLLQTNAQIPTTGCFQINNTSGAAVWQAFTSGATTMASFSRSSNALLIKGGGGAGAQVSVGYTGEDLTLAGGSTGASLVLGQGASGSASVTPAGTGSLIVTKNSTGNNVPGIILKNGALGYTELDLYSGVGDTVKAVIQASDTNSFVAFSAGTNHPILFGINASERMRITTGGNLLIGTTTDSGNGKLQLATHTTSAGGIGFGADNQLFRYGSVQLALTNSSGTSGSAIASNMQLRVENSGNGGIQVNVPDASTGGIYFGRSTDAYYTGIERSGTNLQLRNAGATALTLDSSQNLLTSSGAILYTNRVYNLTGGATPLAIGWTGSAAVLNIFSSGAATFAGAVSVNSVTPSTGAGSGALQVAGGLTTGAASYFGGNVGIGIAGSAVPLDVQTAGSISSVNSVFRLTTTANNSSPKIQFFGKQGSGVTALESGAIQIVQTVNADNLGKPRMGFLVGDAGTVSEKVSIDYLGNVGIGTTTPATKLDVNGAATFAGTVIAPAATTAISSVRLPHGTAPTSPVNGDMWTTTAGLYVRINGVTVGPLS